MANRFNDRDREERNYYTTRGRDREQGGQQDWRNQEGREWYETEQPEYNSDFETGRFRNSSENRGMRSERYGNQNWGQEGGGGQYRRSNEFEDYGQRGGQSFGQGRQSFGQGRSQQGQFQNYGQENWRTHRGSSQEQRYDRQESQYPQGSQVSHTQWAQGSQSEQRGQFTGRGPKGYRRSDDRIKEDINERLTQDADIDAWDLDVQVSGGEVTLTGTVDDRHAKRRAEDIAESVSGVKDVQNQIRVKKNDEEWGSDYKKDSTFSSELSDKDKDKGQGGIKANIK